jgi:hypothetical protein
MTLCSASPPAGRGHFEAGPRSEIRVDPDPIFRSKQRQTKLKFVHVGRTAFAGKIIFLESTKAFNLVHPPKVGRAYYEKFTCSREAMRAS